MEIGFIAAGTLAGFYFFAAFAWSIRFPDHRVWPPKNYSKWTATRVWTATFVLFGSTIYLGLLNWNALGWPLALRWSLGTGLIAIGNVAVWTCVRTFGIIATSGAKGNLETTGLYKVSRNPQYVADILILIGWAILCAAPLAICVAILGSMVLAAAPFAEEPWLEETYGAKYLQYKGQVRRYLSPFF